MREPQMSRVHGTRVKIARADKRHAKGRTNFVGHAVRFERKAVRQYDKAIARYLAIEDEAIDITPDEFPPATSRRLVYSA